MNVNRILIRTVLIMLSLAIMSGYNSPLMAQSDSNADNNNADLSELPSEMQDEEIIPTFHYNQSERNKTII